MLLLNPIYNIMENNDRFKNLKKSKLYVVCFFMLTLTNSCHKKNVSEETPFMSVVKLLSAEQDLKYDEAKNYIDVIQVYSKYSQSQDPEKEWKDLMQFNYNLGEDPKFTNSMRYYEYNIQEIVNGEKAKVILTNKNTSSSIKEIVYSLDYQNNKWVVIAIDYQK